LVTGSGHTQQEQPHAAGSPAALVIAGAGPQALTLCCQLLQKRPRLRLRLRVFDPSGGWLQHWHHQLHRCAIPWLRSPSPHHPHPNAHALRHYAQTRQRGGELQGPFGLPHTALFADFCRQVERDFDLDQQVEPAAVVHVQLSRNPREPLTLGLSDGTSLRARRLVVATGAGAPLRPAWVEALGDGHPPWALAHSARIDLHRCPGLAGQRLLIVGGGLTSGHLALGALRLGARVTLLCRRQLRQQPFDADPGWLGPRYLKAFAAEPCWRRRHQQVLAARNGGSITPEVAAELHQARRGGRLRIEEHCQVERARWQVAPGAGGNWEIHCRNGDELQAERIWLATGQRLGVSQQPLLRQLQQQCPIALVHDHPVLASDLRWPGTSVHVMGGLASLQLGPGARNLFGGREAALRIARGIAKA